MIWVKVYLSVQACSTVQLAFLQCSGCVTPTQRERIQCRVNSVFFKYSRRLNAFFMTLFNSLRSGAKYSWFCELMLRAVIQLYPETPEQMELISKSAMKCGFVGGLVIDFPNR